MSQFTTYSELYRPILLSKEHDNYPFHNMFRSNPLRPYVEIDPRRAGYRPYTTTVNITEQPLPQDDLFYYQNSCSTELPVSPSYIRSPGVVLQP